MGKKINLVGQRFGRLVVLEEAGHDNSNKLLWKCQCDCGIIKNIRGADLRNGKILSCGCLGKENRLKGNINRNRKDNPSFYEDLSGQKFGKLTVLSFNKEYTILKRKELNNTASYWKCKCDCGNIVNVTTSSLKSGHTQSCGCLQKEKAKINMIENIQPLGIQSKRLDLVGRRFGKLIALHKDEEQKDKAYWVCQCDCGNIKSIRQSSLLQGLTQSCGCIGNSLGENLIKEILTNNNVSFIQEYTFNDLKDKNYLRFDFAILDYNGKVLKLIEYDGKQHFNKSSIWHTDKVIEHDKMKDEYCRKNNIPLLRIPYTDYDIIDINYLLLNRTI